MPAVKRHSMLVAGQVRGVRAVKSDLAQRPLRFPHLRLTRSLQESLKLEGEVPNQQLADSLAELSRSVIHHDRFVNQLITDPEVTEPEWLEIIKAVLVESNQLMGMEVEVGAGQLILGGLIQKQSDYNVLISRIQQFISSENMELTNRIGIVPKAILTSPLPRDSDRKQPARK